MTRQQTHATVESGASQLLLWAVRIGVLLVLLTPLIVSTGTYFPFVVGKAIFSRSIIEVTFVLWLILILYDPRYRLGRSWVIAAFGLWLLVSILTGLTGVSPIRSMWSTYERMQGIFDLAHWFCFVIVAASVFRTFASWRVLFSVNLAVGTVVAALGLGQHFDLINFDWIGRLESSRVHHRQRDLRGRLRGGERAVRRWAGFAVSLSSSAPTDTRTASQQSGPAQTPVHQPRFRTRLPHRTQGLLGICGLRQPIDPVADCHPAEPSSDWAPPFSSSRSGTPAGAA